MIQIICKIFSLFYFIKILFNNVELFLNKILIIYNNSSNIEELNILLTNAGYNTYLAEDVNNGLEIAKIYLPDLIICDIFNNGISGSDVVKELHNNERTKIIPLLYLTSSPSLIEMREIMNTGADDYIADSLNYGNLITAIRVRLEKFNSIKSKFSKLSEETIEASEKLQPVENHILVKIGTKLRIIKFESILCVTALKEYSKITTTDSKKYIIRKSLKKWMDILPTISFLQIHRSTIINMEFIERMNQGNDGFYSLYLKNLSEEFQVSVRNIKKIKKRFNV
ncbi:MAG: response regulator transcription factor [Bacteroidetes bacterium]|nr:response regulator transcription factor [Bacteroidota bacterium]MBU1116590.1 response regulator transcription factor [Bacteroidota bacterium]MBU1797188.1 response regulator transcription factor [Bacteroidota bacterium]